jgi:chromate transporter
MIKQKTRPGLGNLFMAWLILGIQSFGGGASTLYLIHQACIKQGWLDEDEFLRAWGLVQISPGINLVKLTVLIGYDLRGWPGLAAALAGLLLPSAAITALMTAGFTAIRDQPLVQAAMKGILPGTIGLGLAMTVQMLQPMAARAIKEGPAQTVAQTLLLAGAGALMADNRLSPVVILLLAGLLAALLMAVLPVRSSPPKEGEKP